MADRNIRVVFKARDNASATIRRLEGSVGRLGRQLGLATAAAAGLAATGFAKLISSAVKVGSTAEQARIRLDSLFGSVEEGARAFSAVERAARRLPFTFEEILEVSPILSVVVDDAGELETRLLQLAEISARFGIDLRTAAANFQRFASAGASQAEIFRERGVNAFLGIEFGARTTAEESLRAWDETFERIEKEGTSAIERLADSLVGIVSMIVDEWFRLRKRIADAGVFDSVKEQLNDLLQAFRNAADSGVLDAWAQVIADAADTAIRALRAVANQLAEVVKAFRPELITATAEGAALSRLESRGQIEGFLRGRGQQIATLTSELDRQRAIRAEVEGQRLTPSAALIPIDRKIAELESELEGLRTVFAAAARKLGVVAARELDLAAEGGRRGGGAAAGAEGPSATDLLGRFRFRAPVPQRLATPPPLMPLPGMLELGEAELDRVRAFEARMDRERQRVQEEMAEFFDEGGGEGGFDLAQHAKEQGFRVAESLVNGIISGTLEFGEILKRALLGFVASFILGPLKNALAISSPSSVTAGYGQELGRGLVVGMTSVMPEVRSAAERMAAEATRGVAAPTLGAIPQMNDMRGVTATFKPTGPMDAFLFRMLENGILELRTAGAL